MTKSARDVCVRRAYDVRRSEDGTRALVDRLWPRGLKKVDAESDQWCKDVGPLAKPPSSPRSYERADDPSGDI